MSKNAQGSFPRLAIVGAHDKKMQGKAAASRWWAMECATAGYSGVESNARAVPRRAVMMPKLPRRWGISLLWAAWNFLCSYFVIEPATRRRGAVLSFRRHGLRAHFVARECAAESFSGKKANGRVHWHSDHAAAPQEEGRG